MLAEEFRVALGGTCLHVGEGIGGDRALVGEIQQHRVLRRARDAIAPERPGVVRALFGPHRFGACGQFERYRGLVVRAVRGVDALEGEGYAAYDLVVVADEVDGADVLHPADGESLRREGMDRILLVLHFPQHDLVRIRRVVERDQEVAVEAVDVGLDRGRKDDVEADDLGVRRHERIEHGGNLVRPQHGRGIDEGGGPIGLLVDRHDRGRRRRGVKRNRCDPVAQPVEEIDGNSGEIGRKPLGNSAANGKCNRRRDEPIAQARQILHAASIGARRALRQLPPIPSGRPRRKAAELPRSMMPISGGAGKADRAETAAPSAGAGAPRAVLARKAATACLPARKSRLRAGELGVRLQPAPIRGWTFRTTWGKIRERHKKRRAASVTPGGTGECRSRRGLSCRDPVPSRVWELEIRTAVDELAASNARGASWRLAKGSRATSSFCAR